MTTLYDLIEHADAIEIDDHFIRYFDVDLDNIENEDDIVLNIQTVDSEHNTWEWSFTMADLECADYDPETKEWTVFTDNEEAYTVTIYNVKPIAVIG